MSGVKDTIHCREPSAQQIEKEETQKRQTKVIDNNVE